MKNKTAAIENYKFQQLSQDHLKILIPIGIVVYLSFFLLDLVYVGFSNTALRWLGYRIIVAAFALYLRFELLKRKRSYKYISWTAVSFVSVGCLFINLMIFETGGVYSEYLEGVLLVATGGIFMLHLSAFYTLITLLMSFLPTVVVIFISAEHSDFQLALIKASFPIGMGFLIFGGSLRSNREFRALIEDQIKSTLTSVLKKAFPVRLRVEVESGNNEILKPRSHNNLLVGFLDIKASTTIGNNISLLEDWYFKDAFVSSVVVRGEEFGFSILNYTGDGVLFSNGLIEKSKSVMDLLKFFNSVKNDYLNIIEKHRKILTEHGIVTGLTCGDCYGDIVSGIIGNSIQSFFTVTGPEVNLAARICSIAQNNSIAMSSKLWEELTFDEKFDIVSEITIDNLKGFEKKLPIIHISEDAIEELINSIHIEKAS